MTPGKEAPGRPVRVLRHRCQLVEEQCRPEQVVAVCRVVEVMPAGDDDHRRTGDQTDPRCVVAGDHWLTRAESQLDARCHPALGGRGSDPEAEHDLGGGERPRGGGKVHDRLVSAGPDAAPTRDRGELGAHRRPLRDVHDVPQAVVGHVDRDVGADAGAGVRRDLGDHLDIGDSSRSVGVGDELVDLRRREPPLVDPRRRSLPPVIWVSTCTVYGSAESGGAAPVDDLEVVVAALGCDVGEPLCVSEPDVDSRASTTLPSGPWIQAW